MLRSRLSLSYSPPRHRVYDVESEFEVAFFASCRLRRAADIGARLPSHLSRHLNWHRQSHTHSCTQSTGSGGGGPGPRPLLPIALRVFQAHYVAVDVSRIQAYLRRQSRLWDSPGRSQLECTSLSSLGALANPFALLLLCYYS